jgi:hypothetical protein
MSPQESKKITSAYNDQHGRLLGYIRRRIPGGIEAEDILQDVFYQLTVGLFILSKILLTGIAPSAPHNDKKDWKRKFGDKFREKCREEATKDMNIQTTEQV